MKVQLVLAALAALLMPTHGALVQCAGASTDQSRKTYESSGSLTADFTQKACAASGVSIDPNRKGNQKCCDVPDNRKTDFINSCKGQTVGVKYRGFQPLPQAC